MAQFKSDLKVLGKVIADEFVVSGEEVVVKQEPEETTDSDVMIEVLDEGVGSVVVDTHSFKHATMYMYNNDNVESDYFLYVDGKPINPNGFFVGDSIVCMSNPHGKIASIPCKSVALLTVNMFQHETCVFLNVKVNTVNGFYCYSQVVDKNEIVFVSNSETGFGEGSELVFKRCKEDE